MMKQTERLIKYLDEHFIVDPLTAWKKIGIYRLSARVLELRAEGYDIITERRTVLNKWGEKISVAFYRYRKEA